MQDDLVPPSMPGQVQLSKKHSFFKKLFSKNEQQDAAVYTPVSKDFNLEDRSSQPSSPINMQAPVKSNFNPTSQIDFSAHTDEIDLDKLREHLGLEAQSDEKQIGFSNPSASFSSSNKNVVQDPQDVLFNKSNANTNNFMSTIASDMNSDSSNMNNHNDLLTKKESGAKLNYSPIPPAPQSPPSKAYTSLDFDDKLKMEDSSKTKLGSSFEVDTTYFTNSKNLGEKDISAPKKMDDSNFLNPVEPLFPTNFDAPKQDLTKSSAKQFDWTKDDKKDLKLTAAVSDVTKQSFMDDISSDSKSKSKSQSAFTKDVVLNLKPLNKSVSGFTEDIASDMKKDIKTNSDFTKDIVLDQKKDMSKADIKSESAFTKDVTSDLTPINNLSDMGSVATELNSKSMGQSDSKFDNKVSSSTFVAPIPFTLKDKTEKILDAPKKSILDSSVDKFYNSEFDLSKSSQKDSYKDSSKDLFQLSTGEKRLVRPELKKEVEKIKKDFEKIKKDRQEVEHQRIMAAGILQKLNLKEKLLDRDRQNFEEDKNEYVLRHEDFEMKKKDLDNLTHNVTVQRREQAALFKQIEDLNKSIYKSQERIMGLETEIRSLEKQKAQKEEALFEKERAIDEKIAFNKRLEENLAKRERTLEEAQNSLRGMESTIRQTGFSNYLDQQLDQKTVVVPKIQGKQDLKKEPHGEVYDLVNQCRNLINQHKIEDAKKLYLKAWQAHHDMLQSGTENDELYDLIRELYDDLTKSELL